MTDIDLYVRFARSGQPVLQLISKHHLRQFALRIGLIRVIVLVPVHIVELDSLDPHIVAQARDHHDAAVAFLDALKQQTRQQEVAVMVRAKHAFMAIHCEFLCRHLCDRCIAHECINSRDSLQHLGSCLAHTGKRREIHTNKANPCSASKFLFQSRNGIL